MTDRGPATVVAAEDLAPDPQDTAVEFRDLRYSYAVLTRGSAKVLNAWVYIAPSGSIAAMVMNDRVQK